MGKGLAYRPFLWRHGFFVVKIWNLPQPGRIWAARPLYIARGLCGSCGLGVFPQAVVAPNRPALQKKILMGF